MSELTCFKAYDVRGRVPDELNEDIAWRIGAAYAEIVKPRRIVVGNGVRLSCEAIKGALCDGLRDMGVDVYDLGLSGTEEIYFATIHAEMDGGIAVTASHNPKNHNGMKLVRADSQPISIDSGLQDIKTLVEQNEFKTRARGRLSSLDTKNAFVNHLLSYIDVDALKPMKVVVNAGNGCAGPVVDCVEPHLPISTIKLLHEPDGTFPHGVPNPMLPENRVLTSNAVIENAADLGVAWDSDFDRISFFDETGAYVESYYVIGLLAEAFLLRNGGNKIVYEPRLTWNTIETVEHFGGQAILCKAGHAFIKECMRRENAIYGGELSGHHYFRDFSYCDSGMIPWLLIMDILSQRDEPLSTRIAERKSRFPCSGEINRQVSDPSQLLKTLENHYAVAAESIDHTDGVSMSFSDWRFNLRKSNTEPLVRLNVESRGDQKLMENKTKELLSFIDSHNQQRQAV